LPEALNYLQFVSRLPLAMAIKKMAGSSQAHYGAGNKEDTKRKKSKNKIEKIGGCL